MSASAFAYLTGTSAKNRILSRLRRAKNPRYALALILGAGYLWMVYLRPISSTRPSSDINTSSEMWMIIGTAFLLVMAGMAWFIPNGPSNLALDKAESAFLLPGPVSSGGLVGYKMLRTQLAIVMTVLVWTVLLRRGGTALALPLRAIGVWMFFTTTNLHRTGAEIVRAAWAVRGGGAMRHHWFATTAIIVVIVGVATSLGLGHDSIVAGFRTDFKPGMIAFAASMNSGPAAIVLWPIHAVLGPMIAGTNAAWLAAMPAALAVLAAHGLWVLNADDEAIDAAIIRATERLEVMRDRAGRSKVVGGSVRPRPDAALRTMPLASIGWPAIAIVWKNILCMRRKMRSAWLSLVVLPALALIVALFAGRGGGGADLAGLIGLVAIVSACVLLIVGPLMLRSDLRDDMLNITALKLLPLKGRTIVAAEVLSVVVPLAFLQCFLVVLFAVSMLFTTNRPFGLVETVALLAGALPAVIVFNAAFVTIQNAAPVLFPAWTKLGAITSGGIEAMGQMMIVVALVLLLLVLMLLLPGGVAAGIIFAGRRRLAAALVAGLIAGAALLAAEVSGLIAILGRALERTEPSDVPG
jgi:ABC-2 type transport system permease protein